mmetsp:Transcript_35506/g.43865  ORF Transcript_35506/g.43865 Transcript_35506/m.43865 type:complete len:223 (+) Transcript_35506:20-688(+)
MTDEKTIIINDDVWSYEENYKAWSNKDLITWLGLISEELEQLYGNTLKTKQLTGIDIHPDRLGNKEYLINTLNMHPNHASELSKIINARVAKYGSFIDKQNAKQWRRESSNDGDVKQSAKTNSISNKLTESSYKWHIPGGTLQVVYTIDQNNIKVSAKNVKINGEDCFYKFIDGKQLINDSNDIKSNGLLEIQYQGNVYILTYQYIDKKTHKINWCLHLPKY